ncbi:MAG: hypothetical protein IPH09_06935 [bacterium]|nr:hypothetical protein [bacterium]
MMSKKMSLLLLSLLVVGLAGSAQATRWDAFSATADCEGWSMEGMVKIGASHPYVDVEYAVAATRDGAVLEEHTGTVRLEMDADAVPMEASGEWSQDLTGDVTVIGTFFLPFVTSGDTIKTFEQVLDCGGDTPVVCAHRPAWWKRHCHEWPVNQLRIANHQRSKQELLCVLRMPALTLQVRLARQLIAAKLNVAAGVEDTAAASIAAADTFLAARPWYSCLSHSARAEARRLIRELREFNRGNCGCGNKALAGAQDPDVDEADDAEDVDDLYGWGDVKSMYR